MRLMHTVQTILLCKDKSHNPKLWENLLYTYGRKLSSAKCTYTKKFKYSSTGHPLLHNRTPTTLDLLKETDDHNARV
jgi:hypothetical protein